MEKVYSGSSIFLAFVLGAITILSIFAVHLIVIPLLYSLFLDLIFLVFYLLILVAVYRTGIVYTKRSAVSLDNLTSQLNNLNIPKKYTDLKDDFDDKKLISELKSIENDIKLGNAFEHDEEYGFVASTKGNVYHNPKCKLTKLINKKFKAYNNNPEFFEKRKYKACKLCIK